MTDAEIREQIDLGHIDTMAREAAMYVHGSSVARVELTPGDMTRYEIIIVHCALQQEGDVHIHWGGDYVVTLVNCDGRSYYWNGDQLHVGYVQDKWVDRLWTAVVLTEFLNRLSVHLEP